MMESFALAYEGDLDPDLLIRALGELDVPAARLLIGDFDPDAGREGPAVWLKPGQPGIPYSTVLDGHFEGEQPPHRSPLEWARLLTPQLGVRCLVDDGTSHPDRYYLVTPQGGWGTVVVDEDAADEGELRIDHALTPIEGAPELEVRPRG